MVLVQGLFERGRLLRCPSIRVLVVGLDQRVGLPRMGGSTVRAHGGASAMLLHSLPGAALARQPGGRAGRGAQGAGTHHQGRRRAASGLTDPGMMVVRMMV